MDSRAQAAYNLDHSIDHGKARLLDVVRVEIVIEVTIVDGKSLKVHTERGKPFGVGIGVDYGIVLARGELRA